MARGFLICSSILKENEGGEEKAREKRQDFRL